MTQYMGSRHPDIAKPNLLSSTNRKDMTEATFRQAEHLNRGYEINAFR